MEGARGSALPLILGKKEGRIAEGRKVGRASDKNPGSSLAQGLDPPLITIPSSPCFYGKTMYP